MPSVFSIIHHALFHCISLSAMINHTWVDTGSTILQCRAMQSNSFWTRQDLCLATHTQLVSLLYVSQVFASYMFINTVENVYLKAPHESHVRNTFVLCTILLTLVGVGEVASQKKILHITGYLLKIQYIRVTHYLKYYISSDLMKVTYNITYRIKGVSYTYSYRITFVNKCEVLKC